MATQRQHAVSQRMAISDVTAALGLKQARIYELLAEGVIPATKAGKSWIILRPAFEAWLRGGGALQAQPIAPASPLAFDLEGLLHGREINFEIGPFAGRVWLRDLTDERGGLRALNTHH